jgi:hypothetical protein
MTPNDTQMDVLMRRYAKRATKRSVDTEHLDADELNAFAQATLPPAARSRYVSHLADCDDCRKLASQLTIAAGAKSEVLAPAPDPISEVSWWRKLKVVLAPASLRYAAFAMVLVAVAGITFMAWRQPRQRNAEIATRSEPSAVPAEALKEPLAADSENKQSAQTFGDNRKPIAQPTAELALNKKESDLTTVSPPPAAKAASEMAATETKSGLADNRPIETLRAAESPAYAPPPPAENSQLRTREQQSVAGATPGGPRRNESYEKYKVDRSRAGDAPKESGEGRAMSSQPVFRGGKQEDSGPRKDSRTPSVQSRDANDAREETRKPETANRAGSDEAPATRTAGGRKFQRNGNVWVDTKFKSSMSVRNVARGSDDYDALDSGLRSIAQQLGGDVVIVWKGKAYRIR